MRPREMQPTTEATPPAHRPTRQRRPFGAVEQRLVAPPREGFFRYWANDEPGRIQRFKDAGYEHVLDDDGKPIMRLVGRGERGNGLNAYLMEIPKEWYDEDMKAQQDERDRTMAAIKEGSHNVKPDDNRYVPQQGIRIVTQRR